MRLGIDIDGVIYKWDEAARYMLCNVLPNSPYKDGSLDAESTEWWWLKKRVSKEHWNWLWDEGVRLGLFRIGSVYPGSIEAIHTLSKKHKVILITHRPKQAVRDTLLWLGLMDLPIHGIHMLTQQEPKSGIHPHCDIYLDDKPENVEELALNTNGHSYVMRRPWNKDYCPMAGSFFEVHDWDDFLRHVRNLNAKIDCC